jgi:hypothetical protein
VTVAMQRRGKHSSTTIEELCLLCGPCRAYIRIRENCSMGDSSGRRRSRQFRSVRTLLSVLLF